MRNAAKARAHVERAAFYAPHSAVRARFHQQRAMRYLGFGRELVNPRDDKETKWADIRVVFCDLDQTFYVHDGGGNATFDENVKTADVLRSKGVHVVYATGNNLALAQAKFGERCALRGQSGIYCNGALILGENGKVIRRASVNHEFASELAREWNGERAPWTEGCGLIGLGAERCYVFNADRDKEGKADASKNFIDHMHIGERSVHEGQITDEAYVRLAFDTEDPVLSLILLLPYHDGDKGKQEETQTLAREWLERKKLFTFSEKGGDNEEWAKARRSNGDIGRLRMVCKSLIASSAIGPEIDMSPYGINKGSAVVEYLNTAFVGTERPRNENIAACGDAKNDLELFGVDEYEPIVRLVMPPTRCKSEELKARATHEGECHDLFAVIAAALDAQPRQRFGARRTI
jgi:hydroxymethylpyrimidine pyrophosphatase-like HAD family hydrolase